MNTQAAFENFLSKVVNLNDTRVLRIKEAQRILTDFIKSRDEFKDIFIEAIPQGSFRQKTIIKPTGDEGTFDVDILIKLKEQVSWTPRDYLTKLKKAFTDSGRYKDITD